jgi:3-hydroxyacyl-CoA dehydrogenase
MGTAASIDSYRVVDGVAVLTINSPPVNALSHAVRSALYAGVERALADEAAEALVLICAGRTFFAGADVTELGKPLAPPLLADVMGLFEASGKPIVSAMHGTALGGGFELALAGHYRVAVPSAVVGLPEVALGLLPGAGGTQRVPRLAGVAAALELIGLGRKVPADEARQLGLLDAVVAEGRLEADAVAFARGLLEYSAHLPRVRDRWVDLDLEQARTLFDRFRAEHPHLFVGLKAPEGVLQAIEAAITLPFNQGLEREREISRALTASPESAAQRHLFFAERAAAKLPGHEREQAPPIIPVALSGAWSEASRLREAGLIVTGPEDEDSLVIVADELDIAAFREAIARQRDRLAVVAVRHQAALEEFAHGLCEPGALVGLSVTAGVAEIVVGAATSSRAALSVQAIARKAGWPAIFVPPSHGLVLSRLAGRLEYEIARLLAGGIAAADIAAAGRSFGFTQHLLPKADGGITSESLERALTWPVMAEALAILREGAALRGSDIDFAMVRAGLWPLWRGGPAFEAQRIGAGAIERWMAAREVDELAPS